MRQFFISSCFMFLSGCLNPATAIGDYALISDDPALQRVTLRVEDARISGQGPCNRYFATPNGPVLENGHFEFGPIASTKMACFNLASEHEYFSKLQRVVRVVKARHTLTLITSDQDILEFKVAN